jgi:hypothetical protein
LANGVDYYEMLKMCQVQISDFSFLFAPRKPAFKRLGAISQNNLTQLPAK